MKKYGILSALALLAALILSACGGGGITLGAFAAMEKTEGDAPFALIAPTSPSPAEFTYSSSDPKVATISGKTVTVLLAGTTTITAAQESMGQWSATRTSAVLTVAPRVCTAPAIRENGLCVQPCVAPAVRFNGGCVAPTTANANFVTRSSVTWMPVTFILHWSDANSFCTTSTINGATGWRLPREFELQDLFASGLMNGQGWTLAKTWSVTAAGTAHVAVDLSNAASGPQEDGSGAYVTCVRNGS
jgi:Bacterial Ig-like domain (group 2)